MFYIVLFSCCFMRVFLFCGFCFFFFKQKTAYEMRISDWSSDVCSSDLLNRSPVRDLFARGVGGALSADDIRATFDAAFGEGAGLRVHVACRRAGARRLIVELTVNLAGTIDEERGLGDLIRPAPVNFRSEEHTYELQ